MNNFWKWFDRITEGMAVLAGVILVFMTAAVCYGVTMRYFFRSPSIWVVQTTEYALLWMVFLGTTWLLREKGHVTVDILSAHLSEASRRWIDVVMNGLAGAACAVIFLYSAVYVVECVGRNVNDVRAVTVPKAVLSIIIPVGSFFLTLQFLRTVWQRYKKAGA